MNEDEVAARLADTMADRYSDSVRRIAAHLRSIADDVERAAEPRTNLTTLRPDFIDGARSIIHKVTWGSANLHLDSLVSDAAAAFAADQGRPQADPTP